MRMAMQNLLSGLLPLYIITEYQKSGGTWVAQMLAEYMGLPFPRNRIPTVRASVLHAHVLPNPLLRNTVVVLRDGRDAVVSSYYHMIFESEWNSPHLVQRTRAALGLSDYQDVRRNLPEFIRYLFEEHHRRTWLRPNQFTWAEFVNAWAHRPTPSVRYEDLATDCLGTMARLVLELTEQSVDMARLERIVNAYSFETQAKRQRGTENTASFLRKGQPGDWKNKFSRKAGLAFDRYAGDELITLGYECDRSWIEQLE